MDAVASNTSWNCVVPLITTKPVHKTNSPIFPTLESRDICTYMEQKQTYHNYRLYFSKESFPEDSVESLKALKDYIIEAASDNGTGLCGGGSTRNGGTKVHRIQCCYFRAYQKKKTDNRTIKDYKDSTIRNDRRGNSRGSTGKTRTHLRGKRHAYERTITEKTMISLSQIPAMKTLAMKIPAMKTLDTPSLCSWIYSFPNSKE